MTIICDMDSVVVNIIDEWLLRWNEDNNGNVKKEDIKSWGIHEYTDDTIYSYLLDEGFFKYLPSIGNNLDIVKGWIDRGIEVVFCSTAPELSETAAYDKRFWLETKMGKKYRKKYSVIFTDRKDLVIGDILIDDYPKNLDGFKGTKILYNQPWSADIKNNYINVNDLSEVDIMLDKCGYQ